VPTHDLDLVPVVLEDLVVEGEAVRLARLREPAGADLPFVVEILDGKARAVAAGVRGVVVGAVGHEGPVEEAGPGVVGDPVHVEDVHDREVPDGQDEPPGVDRPRELVRPILDGLLLTAEIHRLPEKESRAVKLEVRSPALLVLPVGKSAETFQVRELPALDRLRVQE
jgi:hypothetical protein